ncbi:unnamed protein product [Acanthosepion pharaonis]|uniref:Uncharacterized protein n=1 Tax=Acanthosepion pharaonis TaxID=158019 RepID=A0A812B1E1_ACAPH|nr:unnamed protein product [Sepia pharaonis]
MQEKQIEIHALVFISFHRFILSFFLFSLSLSLVLNFVELSFSLFLSLSLYQIYRGLSRFNFVRVYLSINLSIYLSIYLRAINVIHLLSLFTSLVFALSLSSLSLLFSTCLTLTRLRISLYHYLYKNRCLPLRNLLLIPSRHLSFLSFFSLSLSYTYGVYLQQKIYTISLALIFFFFTCPSLLSCKHTCTSLSLYSQTRLFLTFLSFFHFLKRSSSFCFVSRPFFSLLFAVYDCVFIIICLSFFSVLLTFSTFPCVFLQRIFFLNYLSLFLSGFIFFFLPFLHTPTYLHIYLSIYLSVSVQIYLSIK